MRIRRRPQSSVFAIMLAGMLLFVLWERQGIQRKIATLRENAAFIALGDRGHVRIRKSGTENVRMPIILEAGIGGTSAQWAFVQRDLGRDHPVLSYDRRGTGLSDEASEGADALTRVADLNALLIRSELPPPYLMVGYGYGAVLLRLYQNLHPDKVAGLFFIEPDGPRPNLDEEATGGHETYRRAAHLASFGLSRFARLPDVFAGLPTGEREEMALLQKFDRHLLGVAAEVDGAKDGIERVRGLKPLDDVPLGVASAMFPNDAATAGVLELHDAMVRGSKRGFHALIEGARHDTILNNAAFVSQIAADIRNFETMIPQRNTAAEPSR